MKYVLFSILIAALVIFLLGVKPGYWAYHPDEPVTYNIVVNMIKEGSLNSKQFFYPSGFHLFEYFIFKTFALPIQFFKVFFPHPRVFLTALKIGRTRFYQEFTNAIFGYQEIEALYWGRYLNALLAVAVVFSIYLVGKKLFNRKVGLLAAFFTTFNYRFVLSSGLALMDIPNALITVLSFYFSLRLAGKGSRKLYLLSGIMLGLSLSIKYQVFTFPPFFLAHFFVFLKTRNWRKLFDRNFFLALLLVPIVFILLNPYYLQNLDEAIYRFKRNNLRYGVGQFSFYLFPLSYLYHYGIGKMMSWGILIGSIIVLLQYFRQFLFLLSIIFPPFFALVYYSTGGGYTRNFVPVIPFLLILAAAGVMEVARRVSLWLKLNKIKEGMIIASIACLLTAIPAYNSIKCAYYRSRPWSFDLLRDWIGKNIPEHSRLAHHPGVFVPPKDLYRQNFSFAGEEVILSEIQEAKIDYVILISDWIQFRFLLWGSMKDASGRSYWQIPKERLKNSMVYLAAQEYFRCTVAEFLKPWQTFNRSYVVAKIPPKFESKGRLIKNYSFDDSEEQWEVRGKFGFKVDESGWENGFLQLFSLKNLDTLRFSSPPIPVEGNKKYYVSARVRSEDELLKKERDGFLRLDFYDQENVKDLEQVGLITALSSRLYGSDDWVNLEAHEIAPNEAKYMTISFQVSEPSKTTFFIDEVRLYEGEVTEAEKRWRQQYFFPHIEEEFIFPISVL